MGRIFQPARRTGTTVPRVQAYSTVAAQAFKKGALLIDTAAFQIQECGANPVLIIGVALQAAFSGPGNEVANASLLVATTGPTDQCSVAVIDREQEWSGRMVDGANATVQPLAAHVGVSYGTKRLANGEWVIDQTQTTTTSLEITDFVEQVGLADGFHIFKFKEAVLAHP